MRWWRRPTPGPAGLESGSLSALVTDSCARSLQQAHADNQLVGSNKQVPFAGTIAKDSGQTAQTVCKLQAGQDAGPACQKARGVQGHLTGCGRQRLRLRCWPCAPLGSRAAVLSNRTTILLLTARLTQESTTPNMAAFSMDLQTVIETPAYLAAAQGVLSLSERAEVVNMVAENPRIGSSLGGGVRKVRLGRRGKGKSGGIRIVFLFSGEDIPAFLLTVFAKNSRADLSPRERATLVSSAKRMVEDYRRFT